MAFSFNPGQEQTGQPVANTSNNGVPLLVVPNISNITGGGAPVVEAISPFAFRNRGKSKFNVYFQSVVFLVFGIAFIASVGLFAYQGTLKLQISSKKDELDALQVGFKRPPIEDMQKLSSRLTLINKIMNERVSVNTALRVVEESINNPVTYTKFSLSKNKTKNAYDINFSGETTSYASLYQQIEVLKSKVFGVVFQKIEINGVGPLDRKGIASFKVDGVVAINGIEPDGFTVIRKGNQASSTVNVVSSSTAPVESNQGTSTVISNVTQ